MIACRRRCFYVTEVITSILQNSHTLRATCPVERTAVCGPVACKTSVTHVQKRRPYNRYSLVYIVYTSTPVSSFEQILFDVIVERA